MKGEIQESLNFRVEERFKVMKDVQMAEIRDCLLNEAGMKDLLHL